MKEWLYKFFNNSIYADWAVAATTLLLAVVTLIFYFIDDGYTRLLKNSEKNKFYNLGFDFLKTSYASWSPEFCAPTSSNQTVAECIDAFRRQLIEKKIYMGWQDKRRFNRYVTLAQKHASFWEKNDMINVMKYQNKILWELEWLAEKIGRKKEYEQLKRITNAEHQG